MDHNKKAFAIAALRRASYRWPGRYQALKAANRGRNQYECATCGDIFPRRGVQLDHISPIVPVSGWDGFDGYIERLFCDIKGFATVCKPCHSIKTKAENKQRRANGPKRKTSKKQG